MTHDAAGRYPVRGYGCGCVHVELKIMYCILFFGASVKRGKPSCLAVNDFTVPAGHHLALPVLFGPAGKGWSKYCQFTRFPPPNMPTNRHYYNHRRRPPSGPASIRASGQFWRISAWSCGEEVVKSMAGRGVGGQWWWEESLREGGGDGGRSLTRCFLGTVRMA